MTTAVHGTRSRYVMGCRCDSCSAANRSYSREYQREIYYKRHAQAIRDRVWRHAKPSSYYGAQDRRA